MSIKIPASKRKIPEHVVREVLRRWEAVLREDYPLPDRAHPPGGCTVRTIEEGPGGLALVQWFRHDGETTYRLGGDTDDIA